MVLGVFLNIFTNFSSSEVCQFGSEGENQTQLEHLSSHPKQTSELLSDWMSQANNKPLENPDPIHAMCY